MSWFQELGGSRRVFNVEYMRRKMGNADCSEYSIRQVTSFVQKQSSKEVLFWLLTEFKCLLATRETKGLLSMIYAILLSTISGSDNSRIWWEKDLCVSITELEWLDVMWNNLSFSCNVVIQEN